MARRQQPFDNILNVRDVGAFINEASGRQLLHIGRFFRSARPDGASPQDRERLVSLYNIKTIIDLRTETEHIESRRKHADSVSAAPIAAPSDPKAPLRIPEIDYVDIDFNGSGYTYALLQQLSWYDAARLVGLYAFGYRKEAISILSENFMAERGLAGLAMDSLKYCKAEVKAVFDVLANENAHPVLVHCTQGKDRTGLTVLLTLMLLGVPLEAAEKDYMFSQSALEPERAEKVVEIQSIGLPANFADCPPDWVQRVSRCVNDEHGGIQAYLASCGVAPEQQTRIRTVLGVVNT